MLQKITVETTNVRIVFSIIIMLLIIHSYAFERRNTGSNTTNQVVPSDTLKTHAVQDSQAVEVIYANISYYSGAFQNKNMANGKKFNMNDPSIVAHRTLAFGTKVKIMNPENGKSINVVVQDRGPYIRGREMDVSYAAAKILGFEQKGVQYVKIEIYGQRG